MGVLPDETNKQRKSVAGCLSFLGIWVVSFGIGLCITALLAANREPDVPHPTEVHEGIGDFTMGLLIVIFGVIATAGISTVIALVGSGVVVSRMSSAEQHV